MVLSHLLLFFNLDLFNPEKNPLSDLKCTLYKFYGKSFIWESFIYTEKYY